MNSTLKLADDLVPSRMGYGAMQLAGPNAWGPPSDRAEAVRVLRTAVELGITHLDTSDYYGPVVTNEIIREALHPYPEDLRIVTKVGFRRGLDGSWDPSPHNLREQVQANLEHLGLDVLDAANLRVEGPGSIAESFGEMAEMQKEGLVRHLGLSNATTEQAAEARSITPIVFVQNLYNLVLRGDDALVDAIAADGIGFVPFPIPARHGLSDLEQVMPPAVERSLVRARLARQELREVVSIRCALLPRSASAVPRRGNTL